MFIEEPGLAKENLLKIENVFPAWITDEELRRIVEGSSMAEHHGIALLRIAEEKKPTAPPIGNILNLSIIIIV